MDMHEDSSSASYQGDYSEYPNDEYNEGESDEV